MGGTLLFLLLATLPGAGGVSVSPPPASATAPLFTNVSTSANIDFLHTGFGDNDRQIGTGAAWFDFDRDGDLDLYVTRRVGANVLYKNDGGTFTDVAVAMGVTNSSGDGAGVAVADFNNDGWLDFYLANGREDILYRNNNGTSFTNITTSAKLNVSDDRGTSVSWGDYDGDGLLDLYVAQHQHIDDFTDNGQDRLYHNNGDETFVDVSALLGTNELEGAGFIGAWADFDNDGDPDIFLVNDCPVGPVGTQLFRNDGGTSPLSWTFTNVSTPMNVAACEAGMGVTIGDYNRDGWIDFFYSNIGAPVLLENRQTTFYDATRDAKVNHGFTPGGDTRWSWGANFFDFDLDGWQDLYVACGNMRAPGSLVPQPNLLYRNAGDAVTFANATGGSGVNDIDRSRTSVFGDFDKDGDPDLFLVNYEGPAHLFRNNNDNGNNHLIVDLEGVACNRDGIGSRVRIVTPDGLQQHIEIRSGSSLGGGDDIGAYFGLGSNTMVSELLVRWPSGLMQVARDVAANQRMKIKEDPSKRAKRIDNVSGVPEGNGVTIQWKTAFEADNSGFEVQHKRNGVFETFDQVAGTGEMFDEGEYSYDVKDLSPGEHEFRVKQTNSDGSVELSSEVSVALSTPGAPLISAGYPNPFRSQTRLTLAVEQDQAVTVKVYNIKGQLVTVIFSGTVRALVPEPLLFDASERPAGVYFVRVTGETFSLARKIVLVK